MILTYRRLVVGVCIAGGVLVECSSPQLVYVEGAGSSYDGVYLEGVRVGYLKGRVVDAPYLPARGESGWSRLLTRDGFLIPTLEEVVFNLLYLPPPAQLAYFYRAPEAYKRVDWHRFSILPLSSYPGRGRLVGEEFRVKELDNDYLRLVGRGGDEYLAWDFVLGTLDTGEWILLGEDGLYTAVYKDGVVIVKSPYRLEIYDVRGPPYAPFYPVVPVKWVRERLRKLGNDHHVYEPPVDFVYLLMWPLVKYEWSFEFVEERGEYFPVFIWV